MLKIHNYILQIYSFVTFRLSVCLSVSFFRVGERNSKEPPKGVRREHSTPPERFDSARIGCSRGERQARRPHLAPGRPSVGPVRKHHKVKVDGGDGDAHPKGERRGVGRHERDDAGDQHSRKNSGGTGSDAAPYHGEKQGGEERGEKGCWKADLRVMHPTGY